MVRTAKTDEGMLTYMDDFISVIQGLCVLVSEDRFSNKVEGMMTATNQTMRCSRARILSNCGYLGIVFVGVFKQKLSNCERCYPEILEHGKEDLNHPITSMSTYYLGRAIRKSVSTRR
jgi:hypothetical protein